MSKNLVLYCVENGERRPILSLDPDDILAQAKFTARLGEEMRVANARGVSCPDFKIVSEEREADEGGRVVVSAEFHELDSSLKPIGKSCGKLADIFTVKEKRPATSAENATAARARELAK